MQKITPTDEMREAALKLGKGPIIFAYKDGTSVRMETSLGTDPYKWVDGRWVPMVIPDGR